MDYISNFLKILLCKLCNALRAHYIFYLFLCKVELTRDFEYVVLCAPKSAANSRIVVLCAPKSAAISRIVVPETLYIARATFTYQYSAKHCSMYVIHFLAL